MADEVVVAPVVQTAGVPVVPSLSSLVSEHRSQVPGSEPVSSPLVVPPAPGSVVPGVVSPVVSAAVVPPVVPVPAPVTVESVRAEMEELRKSMLPADQLQALQQFAELGKRVWLEQQQRAAQQVQSQVPAVQPVVNAPHPVTGVVPFTAEDRNWLTVDPSTQEVKALPGAPADVLVRWQLHNRTKADFFNRFAVDPAGVLGSMIEERAKAIAAEQYTQQSTAASDQQKIQRIVEQNRGWIFQKDGSGQPKRDALGQPLLSEEGKLYVGFAERLQEQGVRDPQVQDEQAQLMLLGEMTRRRLQAQALAGQTPVVPPAAPPAALSPAQVHAQNQQALLARAAQQAASQPASLGGHIPPAAAVTQPGPAPMPSLFAMAMADAQAMNLKL